MDTFLDLLAQRVSRELPHERENLPPDIQAFRKGVKALNPPPRICAVLLAFFEGHKGQIYLPFMQRPEDGSVHGGQISFPGGGQEDHDQHLFDTAIREAEEEIGISVSQQHVLGTLSDIYIPPSHSLVTPVLAYMPQAPESYEPDPKEVAQVLEFSLDQLRDPRNHGRKAVYIPGKGKLHFPTFRAGKHEIWGATARILSELFLLLDEMDEPTFSGSSR